MEFSAAQIAEVTGGALVGEDTTCRSVSIDSRSVGRGALFVPVVAERDGHDFIESALLAGAGAYLTEREPVGGTAIVVDDTMRALADLGREARRRFDGPVVAITGSVGKTSVKDLARAAIGIDLRVHASERSFNNELGVPLTLCNAPDDTEVLVVEMGARGIGHIDDLCAIASPTVGIVTWVGAVHTSEFGTVEAVARAKGELVQALPPTGTAVLNIDSPHVAAMQELSFAPIVTYGRNAMVTALGVTVDDELRPEFTAVVDGHRERVMLPVHGAHHVSNALAAIAAAHAVGVPLDRAAIGLRSAQLSPWRMELHRSSTGARVLNDAYNANAISTAAALESLAALAAERRVAVLGLMAELGDHHDEDHRAMAELAERLGIELIAYRESAYGREPVMTLDEAEQRIGDLGEDDAILVKGSRVAGLEALADRLIA
ncbi:MAG: UDP-N-acetylmuramoyl-tripeptide--D-alanyl-D-alanine ligase [Actinomycetota bacterium]